MLNFAAASIASRPLRPLARLPVTCRHATGLPVSFDPHVVTGTQVLSSQSSLHLSSVRTRVSLSQRFHSPKPPLILGFWNIFRCSLTEYAVTTLGLRGKAFNLTAACRATSSCVHLIISTSRRNNYRGSFFRAIVSIPLRIVATPFSSTSSTMGRHSARGKSRKTEAAASLGEDTEPKKAGIEVCAVDQEAKTTRARRTRSSIKRKIEPSANAADSDKKAVKTTAKDGKAARGRSSEKDEEEEPQAHEAVQEHDPREKVDLE